MIPENTTAFLKRIMVSSFDQNKKKMKFLPKTVNSCCFCFDLKYGFLTWAIITVVLQLTAIFALLYIDYLPIEQSEILDELKCMLPLIGYIIAYGVLIVIAVIGIIQERSILIYPCLVIMTMDCILATIMYTTLAIAVSWMYFVIFVSGSPAVIYVFICILSLYKQIKRSEENNPQSKNNGMNLV
ncbi:hypothetical protein ILUMI_27149 [Ignelater luminosus]|uniref:Uncharacterized protein n=1 Tax=Ignelater luminosus TaxID=2038154 RepID=A0A8K0C4W0_IGNLU|nr:hypothetical protein ILUMI_27149 [Ignelater luminosus]